jgi:hypothetical protein
MMRGPDFGQPSLSKPSPANPRKSPWVCLVLFVQIGTFQWVAAIKNENFFPRYSPDVSLGIDLDSGHLDGIAQSSDFRNLIDEGSAFQAPGLKGRGRDLPAPTPARQNPGQVDQFYIKTCLYDYTSEKPV